MFAGDTLTTDTHTFTDNHAFHPWDLPASASNRQRIAALREEDETAVSHSGSPAPHHAHAYASTPDLEQTLSAALRSSAARQYTPTAHSNSPNPASAYASASASCTTLPATPSNANVSASPAAAFLSFFSSPTPQQAAANPDDEGQKVSGYTLGPIIGYGATSIIRRATSAGGTQQAAVKIIRRSDLVRAGNAPQARRKLEHEASVWSSLSHEHILPLFEVVHDTYADYFFTLYCPAGTLLDILNRDGSPALPQDDAGMMLRQVVRGLRYLHEIAGYVHRDLKLENVLVDETGVCKIGDFGLSRRIDSAAGADDSDEDQEDYDYLHHLPSYGLGSSHNNTNNGGSNAGVHRAVSLAVPPSKRGPRGHHHYSHLNQHHPHHAVGMMRHNSARHRNSTSTSTNDPAHCFQPGSLPYAAPELLLPQTSEGRSPHPSQDIWALGVMLYALLTGRLPFTDSFEPRLQMKILNGYYTVPPGIGKGAERILAGCLKSSVQERWTIAMVDEVSWGVGWGAEGDDAEHEHEEDDHDSQYAPSPLMASSRSRSHSRPPLSSARSTSASSIKSNMDWQKDEPRSRGSQEAASRRSTSRAARSQSRAPLMPTPPTSASGARSARSTSRHPTRSRSPPTSAVSASAVSFSTSTSATSTSSGFPRSPYPPASAPPIIPLRTPSASTSTSTTSSSSQPSLSYLASPYRDRESALETSSSRSASASPSPSPLSPSPPILAAPTPPFRGRPQTKHPYNQDQQYYHHQHNHDLTLTSTSRSASPSVVPTTPRDGPLVDVDVDLRVEDMHLDADPDSGKARGRQAVRKDHHSPLNLSSPAGGHAQAPSNLSVALAMADAGMMRSDSFRSTSTTADTNSDVAQSPVGLVRRRAVSSQPHDQRRPTSSPPTGTSAGGGGGGFGGGSGGTGGGVGGPRMLNLNLNITPPTRTPLDPFLTPASVTSTLLNSRSRSAHPRG